MEVICITKVEDLISEDHVLENFVALSIVFAETQDSDVWVAMKIIATRYDLATI